jgi:hypothetical protein
MERVTHQDETERTIIVPRARGQWEMTAGSGFNEAFSHVKIDS